MRSPPIYWPTFALATTDGALITAVYVAAVYADGVPRIRKAHAAHAWQRA
ncbi:MAG: hypothetical protein R3E31_16180 [Chloroflexota bacterium]